MGNVRYTSMGKNVVELLKGIDHPVTQCAALVVEELEEEIEFYKRDYDASYDYNHFRKFKSEIEEVIGAMEERVDIDYDRIVTLTDRCLDFEDQLTLRDKEIAALKHSLREMQADASVGKAMAAGKG